MQEQLARLRHEIDAIDDQIIDLLKKRTEFVTRVGMLKEKHHNDQPFIRPNREADMIRSLIHKTQNYYPAHAIYSIWRTIITSSLQMESPFTLAIPKTIYPNPFISQYFGHIIESQLFDNSQTALRALEQNRNMLAILPFNSQEDWWQLQCQNDNKIYVIAYIPFILDDHTNPLLLLATYKGEPSSNDQTLVAYTPDNQDLAKRLIALNLSFTDISSKGIYDLVQIDGYLSPDDPLFNSDHYWYIGHFATPIKV